jgi:hypothetical protein
LAPRTKPFFLACNKSHRAATYLPTPQEE